MVQAIVPLLETVIGELGHSEFDGAGVRESVFAALGFPRTETSSLGVSIGTVLRSALVNPANCKGVCAVSCGDVRDRQRRLQ